MKKIRGALIVLAALIMLVTVSAHAETKMYKAGIVNDYDFEWNNISPYAQSALKSVFVYLDNSGLEFSQYNLEGAKNALSSGAADFISMLPKTEQLAASFDFTDRPVATAFLSLFVKNDKELYFEDYKKFNGMKVAMLQDSYFKEYLDAYAQKNSFTYAPVYFQSHEEMYAALSRGEADAMLSPATDSPENMRLIAKCGDVGYYCAVSKGDSATLSMLNELIETLDKNTPFYLSSEYEKNFTIPYRNMIALTQDDYDISKDQKQLRVMVPDNRYPMVYYSIEDGTYEGIFIDILRQITENAGLELSFVSGDQQDMALDSMTFGKADALLCVSGSTQGIVEATDPYTSISFMPVEHKDKVISSDSSAYVGILKDDTWVIDYLNREYPQWQIRTYNSLNSLLSAAERRKIDFALISTPDMQTKTSLIAHPSLTIGSFGVNAPVSLGISRVTCRPQVVTMMNDIIQNVAVPNEEFETKAYVLNHIYVPNFRDLIFANKIWVFLIILALAGVFAMFRSREKYYKRLARTDSLTHIYNSRYFFKTADKLLSKNSDKSYLLASLDAVNFKLVNDRFGRVIGDQTLTIIASKISKLFRGNGLFARFQGDNFVVLVEDTPEKRALIEELEKLDIHIHDSTNYHVLIKTGVCPISDYNSETPLTGFIDKANIAKHGADGTNQNYLRYFTDEMASQLKTRNDIEVDMVPALARGEFIVYYQPKYELEHNTIIGAEALVRWNHKTKGLIPPGIFVPLFEKNGFITEVDFSVYESVLKMLKSRIKHNKNIVTVSMNVSRCHLTDPKFIERLNALVAKYDVPKRYIEMEITESIFSEGDNSAFALVYELKRQGYAVSMDDFGSGYSSLNLLRKMPIDTLKIDKVFIDDIEVSPRSQKIVEQVIALSHRIDVKTICEGVETEEQCNILKSAGCNMVQGYFFSKPLPSVEFENLLDKS